MYSQPRSAREERDTGFNLVTRGIGARTRISMTRHHEFYKALIAARRFIALALRQTRAGNRADTLISVRFKDFPRFSFDLPSRSIGATDRLVPEYLPRQRFTECPRDCSFCDYTSLLISRVPMRFSFRRRSLTIPRILSAKRNVLASLVKMIGTKRDETKSLIKKKLE